MFIAYTAIAVLLTLALVPSAYAKLTKNKRIVDGLTGIGVPLAIFPFLASCEIAGAAGLLVGLWYAPLGIAAAIGLTLYFLGAVGATCASGTSRASQPPGDPDPRGCGPVPARRLPLTGSQRHPAGGRWQILIRPTDSDTRSRSELRKVIRIRARTPRPEAGNDKATCDFSPA